MAPLRLRRCDGVCTSWALGVVGAVLLFAPNARAAQITWVSSTPAGGSDEPFISLLQGAGHTVTRFPSTSAITGDQLSQLNASDLVIIGRATGSAEYDAPAEEANWNQNITTRVMVMSAYITRNNRLGWQTGNTVPDSGPTRVVAANPAHPIFQGITFGPDATTANEYNIQIDRGTTIMGDPPVPGGTVIARHPTIANGVIAAEWLAGTTAIADNGATYVMSNNRYYFAGGSREADGQPVTTAGQMDLTPDGQRMFLNFVGYAAIPEPSTVGLAVLGAPLLLRRSRRRP